MKKKSVQTLLKEYFIIIIFIVLIIILSILSPSFLNPRNIVNILRQTSISGILALGMMFVIISGGFDLSVGSTIGLAGILSGMLVSNNHAVPLAFLTACIVGGLVGLLNGVGISKGNLPPFIMTLGTMTGIRGLALVITDGKPVTGMPQNYTGLASGLLGGWFPFLAIYYIIAIAICAFVLERTVFGRRVYALGGNLQAARVAGINTSAMTMLVYSICGLLAGICGFLLTARVTVAQPTAGESYEMDAITACVIGGISMTGGTGKWFGSVIGALLITVISNGLDIMGVSSHFQKIIKGVIIIVAVLLDVRSKTKKA